MDFLKKLTAPGFQVQGYGQGLVQFKCSKALKPGISIDGLASLPGGVRCDLTVSVTEVQAGVYTAQVQGPKESITLLEKIFLPSSQQQKQQMFYKPNEDDLTRHARTYSIRSRDFPGFKGSTAELSRAGALVMLGGDLAQGKELLVQIDLDDTDLPPIPVEASVDWCAQRDQKTWIASLTFKSLPAEQDTLLAEFLEGLKFRNPGERPLETS